MCVGEQFSFVNKIFLYLLGDCVYLRRDYDSETVMSNENVQEQIIAQGMESGDVAARESLRGEKTEELDIFRIERLWKDDK